MLLSACSGTGSGDKKSDEAQSAPENESSSAGSKNQEAPQSVAQNQGGQDVVKKDFEKVFEGLGKENWAKCIAASMVVTNYTLRGDQVPDSIIKENDVVYPILKDARDQPSINGILQKDLDLTIQGEIKNLMSSQDVGLEAFKAVDLCTGAISKILDR